MGQRKATSPTKGFFPPPPPLLLSCHAHPDTHPTPTHTPWTERHACHARRPRGRGAAWRSSSIIFPRRQRFHRRKQSRPCPSNFPPSPPPPPHQSPPPQPTPTPTHMDREESRPCLSPACSTEGVSQAAAAMASLWGLNTLFFLPLLHPFPPHPPLGPRHSTGQQPFPVAAGSPAQYILPSNPPTPPTMHQIQK